MILTVTTLYSDYPAAFWICLGMTIVLAGAGVALATAARKKGVFATYDAIVAAALWCYAVVVLYFTVIGRYSKAEYRYELTPFRSLRKLLTECGAAELKNLLINFAMLMPVAFLLCELRRKKDRPAVVAIVGSLGFSVVIEALQFVSRTGTFEIDDLIFNFAGAFVSTVIWCIFNNARVKRITKDATKRL